MWVSKVVRRGDHVAIAQAADVVRVGADGWLNKRDRQA